MIEVGTDNYASISIWREDKILTKLFPTLATLAPAFRVKRSTREAPNVHGAGEPGGDDPTQAEYSDHHHQVEQHVSQRRYRSCTRLQ